MFGAEQLFGVPQIAGFEYYWLLQGLQGDNKHFKKAVNYDS